MVSTCSTEKASKYEIISAKTVVENAYVIQYGIKMESIAQPIEVANISEDLEIVQALKLILEENDVDPCNLQEIVEDYIAEIYTC